MCRVGEPTLAWPGTLTLVGLPLKNGRGFGQAHFGCNYVAHVLFTLLLLPCLRRAGSGARSTAAREGSL
jgi:hypothetical protein